MSVLVHGFITTQPVSLDVLDRFGATICLSARKTKGVIRWCPRGTTSGELVDCCLGHTGPYKLQICLQSRSNTKSEWTEQRLLEPSWQESRKLSCHPDSYSTESVQCIPCAIFPFLQSFLNGNLRYSAIQTHLKTSVSFAAIMSQS